MQYDRTCEWTGLKFSNDGKLILISTNGGFIRLIDAFKGAVLHTFGVSMLYVLPAWNLALGVGLGWDEHKLKISRIFFLRSSGLCLSLLYRYKRQLFASWLVFWFILVVSHSLKLYFPIKGWCCTFSLCRFLLSHQWGQINLGTLWQKAVAFQPTCMRSSAVS